MRVRFTYVPQTGVKRDCRCTASYYHGNRATMRVLHPITMVIRPSTAFAVNNDALPQWYPHHYSVVQAVYVTYRLRGAYPLWFGGRAEVPYVPYTKEDGRLPDAVLHTYVPDVPRPQMGLQGAVQPSLREYGHNEGTASVLPR
jgi:hypothetical protein